MFWKCWHSSKKNDFWTILTFVDILFPFVFFTIFTFFQNLELFDNSYIVDFCWNFFDNFYIVFKIVDNFDRSWKLQTLNSLCNLCNFQKQIHLSFAMASNDYWCGVQKIVFFLCRLKIDWFLNTSLVPHFKKANTNSGCIYEYIWFLFFLHKVRQ